MTEPAVQMIGITKSFPQVLANDHVDLELFTGEVHVLLGENGAGKSTLMNVLYGLYHPDSGRILVNRKEVSFRNPLEAQAHGIGMVHQHFSLVPDFTVAENFAIGAKDGGVLLRLDVVNNKAKSLEDKFGIKVDLGKKIRDLSVGERQRAELLKLLFRGANVLILDEPTSALTPQESESLFQTVDSLKREGRSIVLITHKLYEVAEVADRVTVLRKGRVVFKCLRSEISVPVLTESMVGKAEFGKSAERLKPKTDISLAVRGLSVEGDSREQAVTNADLELRVGEILGVAGVAGNGQKEFVEALAGLRKTVDGHIFIRNRDITSASCRTRISLGIRYIPDDRKGRGIAVSLSLVHNSALRDHWQPPFAEGMRLNYSKVREFGAGIVSRFGVVTPSVSVKAGALSGGNLQKFIVGREVSRNPVCILAENPTAGLDVAATEFVRRTLIDLRNGGTSVLLVSGDLDELLQVSDRLVVMYRGKISPPVERKDFDKQRIGAMMLGSAF